MPDHHHTLPITLGVVAPFLSQGTALGHLEYDTVAVRGHDQGEIVIPGTQMKGLLRDAWEQLEGHAAGHEDVPDRTAIDRWLGVGMGKSDNQPSRGKLRFLDFSVQEAPSEGTRYRVSIDESRGSVAPMMLMSIETPYSPGQTVPLRGSVDFVADEEERDRIVRAIGVGLRFVSHVGALRGQGFGRLRSVELGRMTTSPKPSLAVTMKAENAASESYLDLVLETADPILVSQAQPNTNLFKAGPVIPGAVLKGALASTWREHVGEAPSGPIGPDFGDPERSDLACAFESVRFTHASLGSSSARGAAIRPMAIPLSLVVCGWGAEETFFDVALLDGPHLIDGEAPRFQIDWKKKATGRACRLFGWPKPTYRTRVRSAVDASERRSAEGQLFAHRALLLGEDQALLARVDLSAIDDRRIRARVAQQLRSLLAAGLRHVGKAKARVEVRESPLQWAEETVAPADRREDDPIVVVLQTPALIADPLALDLGSGRPELVEAYASAFRAMAKARSASGDLELIRFFSTERLAGGEYFRRRFQSPNNYHPYLLSDAGSVFVFRRTEEAAACLADWQERGMPLPPWAVERYTSRLGDETIPGHDWRRCPYVPAGGYGEIAVDLAVHWRLEPRPHQRTKVEVVSARSKVQS